jgi:hypothetical protein
MNRIFVLSLITVACFMISTVSAGGEPALAHIVFFKLKDASPKAKQALVAACYKHLANHDGTVYFSAGVVAEEFKRDVNVRDFDVSLHLVFKSKADHDKYQSHPRHEQFITENKDNWANVRVFDSYVQGMGEKTGALPAPARGFAGMIRGKVSAIGSGAITMTIDEVVQVWSTNRAENPKAMLGQNVTIDARGNDGQPVASAARYIASLKVGETVSLDVRHAQSEVLSVLELTAEQRARVAID